MDEKRRLRNVFYVTAHYVDSITLEVEFRGEGRTGNKQTFVVVLDWNIIWALIQSIFQIWRKAKQNHLNLINEVDRALAGAKGEQS